jgi:nicotinamide phosphoribosyltransferase
MWNDKVVEKLVTKRVADTPSIILDADSYKMSHFAMYPENTNAMFSYIEARTKDDTIIPFGLQMWIKKNLLTPITLANINEAEDICKLHGVPFNRGGWEYILDKYNGFLPIKIRGIPEGTPTPSQTPLVTVECTDPVVYWLASFIETSLQRGVWYPTSIASNDYKAYNGLKWIYDKDSDNPVMLDFSLHSFGSRGVSSRETAEIGGLAHLIFFKGTDDVVALKAAREYYNCEMAGYSVVATEHSIQCSYGIDGQEAYLNRVLDVFGTNGRIVSVVMDGYDIYREVDLLCTEQFVNKVKQSGCKFVVRPDSGDPFIVIPIILEKLAKAYGTTKNSKGKLVLNNVGIIQGDGINATSLMLLSQKIHSLGYAPECVIYGSGGGLLQKVDRDTYSFAQKTSAIRVGEEWIPTVKSPITDSGKKSKGGRLDGEQFITYYENGKLLVDESLDTIRARALS